MAGARPRGGRGLQGPRARRRRSPGPRARPRPGARVPAAREADPAGRAQATCARRGRPGGQSGGARWDPRAGGGSPPPPRRAVAPTGNRLLRREGQLPQKRAGRSGPQPGLPPGGVNSEGALAQPPGARDAPSNGSAGFSSQPPSYWL